MVQLIIDIPDDQETRIITAICNTKGYSDSLGISQRQFAKRYIVQHIKDVVRFYEREEAKKTAISGINDVNVS